MPCYFLAVDDGEEACVADAWTDCCFCKFLSLFVRFNCALFDPAVAIFFAPSDEDTAGGFCPFFAGVPFFLPFAGKGLLLIKFGLDVVIRLRMSVFVDDLPPVGDEDPSAVTSVAGFVEGFACSALSPLFVS